MGLFSSLFSSKPRVKPSGKKEFIILIGAAKFEVMVTQEEHYQAALETICGPRAPRGVNRFETAYLKLEDKIPRDPNAVRVEMRGKQVGYLRPQAAISYRQYLITKGMPKANGQCQAVVRGGWVSSDGRKGLYEIWLDFPAL